MFDRTQEDSILDKVCIAGGMFDRTQEGSILDEYVRRRLLDDEHAGGNV